MEACRWWSGNIKRSKPRDTRCYQGSPQKSDLALPTRKTNLQTLLLTTVPTLISHHVVCSSVLGLFVKTNMKMQFLKKTKWNYQDNYQLPPQASSSKVKDSSKALIILKLRSSFPFLFVPEDGSLHLECGTKDSENTNNICSSRSYKPCHQKTNTCLAELILSEVLSYQRLLQHSHYRDRKMGLHLGRRSQ